MTAWTRGQVRQGCQAAAHAEQVWRAGSQCHLGLDRPQHPHRLCPWTGLPHPGLHRCCCQPSHAAGRAWHLAVSASQGHREAQGVSHMFAMEGLFAELCPGAFHPAPESHCIDQHQMPHLYYDDLIPFNLKCQLMPSSHQQYTIL